MPSDDKTTKTTQADVAETEAPASDVEMVDDAPLYHANRIAYDLDAKRDTQRAALIRHVTDALNSGLGYKVNLPKQA